MLENSGWQILLQDLRDIQYLHISKCLNLIYQSLMLMSATTIKRYLAPPENTIQPLEYAFYLLGDVRGKTILEYGCGDGMNTVVLSKRGAKVVALDLSPELLELARKRSMLNHCDRTTFVLGSAHALPPQNETVDIVSA